MYFLEVILPEINAKLLFQATSLCVFRSDLLLLIFIFFLFIMAFYGCDKDHDPKQLGEERLHWA